MLKVQKYFILSCLISISFTQIFFSEYAEGSSNNKYLEIYNATNNVIDLSGYGYPSTANAPSVPGEYEYRGGGVSSRSFCSSSGSSNGGSRRRRSK